jgi:hypothetical protein
LFQVRIVVRGSGFPPSVPLPFLADAARELRAFDEQVGDRLFSCVGSAPVTFVTLLHLAFGVSETHRQIG